MIKTIDLVKSYEDDPAVRGVNLEVPAGQLCVLLGPSGCGKSTLLKLINALIPPETLRRGIGYVVQNVGLFPHYTVRRNIGVVMKLLKKPKAEIEGRVRFLLELIGLPQSYADRYPRELSGGEAQRVGVARALAADPKILLMDEPFGSVDPLNRERLQKSFLDIHRTLKKTVLFVTHDVSEALVLGDRIVLMQEGRVAREGTPGDLVFEEGDAFSRAFFGSEMALKLLTRYTVGQAYTRGLQPESIACAASKGKKAQACAVNGDMPLSEALSLMIINGCRDLMVGGEGYPEGTLSFDSLLSYFRKGAPDGQ